MAPKPSHIHVLEGEPPIRLTLRRSARARRVTLRVSQLDGQVFLTLPHHLPAREAIAFAQSKEDWIRAHLTKIAQPQLVDYGDALLVMGHPRLIVPTDDRRVTLDADQIRVPARKKPAAPQLAAFLKDLARQQVVSAADLYAKRLGKDYSAISLRDTRSRWGIVQRNGSADVLLAADHGPGRCLDLCRRTTRSPTCGR